MDQGQDQRENSPGREEMEISLFRPEDAPGVAELFRAVYGEGYPVKVYYHPDQLVAAVAAGDIIQVVARAGQGRVVGVESMFHTAPFEGVYEMGAGLVLAEFRNRGLSKALNRHLTEEVIPQGKVAMAFGEPVCNHVFQQKAREGLGYVNTALEVDLMPAAAYSREGSASGRVAALMGFKGYQERVHEVWLPGRHAWQLREIYQGTGQERIFREADPSARLRGATQLKAQVFDFAQTARVAVPAAGADLAERLDELLAELRGRGVVVAQAWLDLASPAVGAAVEVLRARGFFLGGLLPRWFDQDGLLLQKVYGLPNWEEIQVASTRSLRILEMVRQDWREAGQA